MFNGDVEIRLSTDGKFLAIGTLNITGLSVAARLYGDLSQIAKGEGKFLYLMTAPDELELLEAGGEFTFGFLDSKGAEIVFTPPRSGSGLASATFSVLPAVNVGIDYPVAGARVDVAQWVASKTLVLRVSSTDGSTLDNTTLADGQAVLTLRSPQGKTFTLKDPASMSAGLLTYSLPSDFVYAPGTYTVDLAGGVFGNQSGLSNAPASFTLDVQGAAAGLFQPAIDAAELALSRAIDVRFTATQGAVLDTDSILDAAAEVGVRINGEVQWLAGNPEALGSGVFRYRLPAGVAVGAGTLEVVIAIDSFRDSAGYGNVSGSMNLTVRGVTLEMLGLGNNALPVDRLNANGYFDVQFRATTGASLIPASVTDAAAEFALGGIGATGVQVDDTRTIALGDGVFRYYFSGRFSEGAVTLTTASASATDSAGNTTVSETSEFEVAALRATLVRPTPYLIINKPTLNSLGAILFEMPDRFGTGLDEGSIADSAPEFVLEGIGAANVVLNGSGTRVVVDGRTYYRYSFIGDFVDGLVDVRVVEGGYKDLAGNANKADATQFGVRQQASAFVVRLSGFVNLKLLSDKPVAGLRGDLTVTTEVLTSVDQPDLPIGFRMVLGAVGTVTLLGNELPKANVRWIYSAGAFGPGGSFAETFNVEMGLGDTPSLGGKLNLPSWFPFDIRKIDIDAKSGVLTLSGAINQLGIPGFNVSGVCDNLRLDLNNDFQILGWDALGLGFELSLPGFGYLKAEGLFGLMKFDAAHNRIVDGDTTTPVAETVMYLGFSVDVRNDMLTMVGPFALATAALAKAGSPLAPIMGGLTLALGPLLPIQGLGIKVRMALSDYGLLSINLGFSLSMLPVYGEFEGQVTFYRTLPSLTSPIQLRDPSLRFNPPLGDWLTQVQGQLQQQVLQRHRMLEALGLPATRAVILGAGIFAPLLQPFVISGRVSLKIGFGASLPLSEGSGEFQLSTDGKLLITTVIPVPVSTGVPLPGPTLRLYGDISQILKGSSRFMFLLTYPDPLAVVVLGGQLSTDLGLTNVVDYTYVTRPAATGDSVASGPVIALQYVTGVDAAYFVATRSLGIRVDFAGNDPFRTATASFPAFDLVDPAGRVHTVTRYTGVVDGAHQFVVPESVPALSGVYRVRLPEGFAKDAQGKTSAALELTLEARGPTMALDSIGQGGSVALDALKATRWIDVSVRPSLGKSLTEEQIRVGLAASLKLNGVVVATLTGATRVSGDTYRFVIPESVALTTGEATIEIAAGLLTDSGGFKNTAASLAFVIQGPQAELLLFVDSGLVSLARINAKADRSGSVGGYLDVAFETTDGSEVDAVSVLDAGAEFTLGGTAARSVTVRNDRVSRIGRNLFRYAIDGQFTAGELTVDFVTRSFSQGSGAVVNVAASNGFRVATTSGELMDPTPYERMDRALLNDRKYLLVRYSTVNGVGLDGASITDAGLEFNVSGAGAGSVKINGAGQRVTLGGVEYWKYGFSGEFTDGVVRIDFVDGSWTDLEGSASVSRPVEFGAYTRLPRSVLRVEGFADIQGAEMTPDLDGDGVNDPFLSLRGSMVLTTEVMSNAVSWTLQAAATVEVFGLGNLGSAAGSFTVKIGAMGGSGGALGIGANVQVTGALLLDGAVEFQGVRLEGQSKLVVNTTGGTVQQTLRLEGIEGDEIFSFADAGMSGAFPTVSETRLGGRASIPSTLRSVFQSNGYRLGTNVMFRTVRQVAGSGTPFGAGSAWTVQDNDNQNRVYFLKLDEYGLIHVASEFRTVEIEPYTLALGFNGKFGFQDVLNIEGSGSISLSATGASVTLSGSLITPIMRFAVSGELGLSWKSGESGLYGSLQLGLSMGSTTIPNVALSGTFQLEVNGTAIARQIRQLDINPTTGAVQGLVEAEMAPATIRIRASGTLRLAAFEMTGAFSFGLSSAGMTTDVSASVKLGPLGTGKASGSLRIDGQGVLGALLVVGDSGVGDSLGIAINGSLRLEINTAATSRTVTLGGAPLVIASGFLLRMSGNMVFAGLLDGAGSLELSYDAATRSFTVVGSLEVNLAGGLLESNLRVFGILNSAGLVLVADVAFKTTVLGLIGLDATGKLYINTRKTSYIHPVTAVSMAASSVFLQVKGRMTLLGLLSMDVNARLQVGGTFERPAAAVGGSVSSTATLRRGEWGIALSTSVGFFGIATLGAQVWVQSNGSFGLSLAGTMRVGSGVIYVSGRLGSLICFDSETDVFLFNGSASGRLQIGPVGINGAARLNYDSSSGRVSLYATIPILFGSVSHTWDVAVLPKPVKGMNPATQPITTLRNSAGINLENGDAVGDSGVLLIDMTRSSSSSQSYVVRLAESQVAVAGGGQSVEVVHLGRVLVFHGVRTIRVQGGNEASTLDIQNGINAQVLINDTGGDNNYTLAGGSVSLMNEITLGAGNDTVNTTMAPAGARFTVRGGNGSNLIETGAAADLIYGGAGTDRISAGGGNDTVYTGTGTSYVTLDSGRTELHPNGRVARLFTTSSEAGADTLIGAATGTVYVLGGGGADTITTGSGADVIVGDEGTVSFGTDGTLQSIVGRASENSGSDNLDAGGGNNVVVSGMAADRITVGVGTSLMLAGNGTVTVTTAGRTVSGLSGGGAVEVVCATGTIVADETVTSGTLSVTSVSSLVVNSLTTSDASSPLALVSSAGDVTVNATSGAAGSLSISAYGSITVSQLQPGIVVSRAQSLGSTITISGPADISVESASSKARSAAMRVGWDITVIAGGTLKLGLIQAPGATVTLAAGGGIEELGDDSAVDLMAKSAILTAVSGIGGLGAIETQLGTVSAVATTGDINLSNTGSLTVTLARTQAATGGNITLTADSGALSAVQVTALGKGALISLTTKGSGDVLVGTVAASDGKIEVFSVGFVESLAAKPDGENHLVAGSVKLSAAAVGTTGAVKVLELGSSLKSVTGLPDLRTYLGMGWTERVWNNISGSSDTARLAALNGAAASKPAGDTVRLRQTEVSTPVTTVANNFGVIASGWMLTSTAGDYRFWAAADDVAQLWIYDADGNALGGGPVVTSPYVVAGTWTNAPRSAAVRLEAATFYRFEVRFVDISGGEYFRVGYATGANPTTPQVILGATTPLVSGAATPISIMPDFAGSVVTVKLSAGTGSTLDVGRSGLLDKAWTLGASTTPNLTLQGDRTDTVSVIGSLSNIQAFLQTEGLLRYSVLTDSVLKISVSAPSMPATTNGTTFTNRVFSVDLPGSVLPNLTLSSASNAGTLTPGVLEALLGKTRRSVDKTLNAGGRVLIPDSILF